MDYFKAKVCIYYLGTWTLRVSAPLENQILFAGLRLLDDWSESFVVSQEPVRV